MAASADVSQLRRFEYDLGRAPARVLGELRPILSKGALNIKTEMQMDFATSEHFKGITFSVSYDLVTLSDALEARIGPDKGRGGGALANIAYFGGSHGGGGTVRDPREPMMEEEPRLLSALSDLLGDAL